MSSSPLPRALLAASGLLLLATATLLTQVIGLRAQLASASLHATLAEQELRSLRQQLEAERLLAAGQARLLREALTNAPTPPGPTSATP